MLNLKENYRLYIRVVCATIAVWFIFSWFQDILSGEEGRVRRFIGQGKRAIESKNILACAEMISSSYHDKYDNEKQNLIYIARELFSYYKKIFISIEKMEIKLDSRKVQASIEIEALVIGQTKQDRAEKILEGEKGRFKVRLVKEEKKWRLIELEFFEPVTIMHQNIS